MTDKQTPIPTSDLRHYWSCKEEAGTVLHDTAKQTRLKDLKARLKKELPWLMYQASAHLLDDFKFVFEMQEKAKQASGLKKLWYIMRALPTFKHGLLLDVALNQTMVRYRLPKYRTGWTVTASLKNTKALNYECKSGYVLSVMRDKELDCNAYGFASQVCRALNDYDPGHC